MLWVGLQDTGKITILVSIAIFPVIINTYSGIKDVRGSLLEIGRGRRAPESVSALLAARDRTQAGPTAPAKGLHLVRVDYP